MQVGSEQQATTLGCQVLLDNLASSRWGRADHRHRWGRVNAHWISTASGNGAFAEVIAIIRPTQSTLSRAVKVQAAQQHMVIRCGAMQARETVLVTLTAWVRGVTVQPIVLARRLSPCWSSKVGVATAATLLTAKIPLVLQATATAFRVLVRNAG